MCYHFRHSQETVTGLKGLYRTTTSSSTPSLNISSLQGYQASSSFFAISSIPTNSHVHTNSPEKCHRERGRWFLPSIFWRWWELVRTSVPSPSLVASISWWRIYSHPGILPALLLCASSLGSVVTAEDGWVAQIARYVQGLTVSVCEVLIMCHVQLNSRFKTTDRPTKLLDRIHHLWDSRGLQAILPPTLFLEVPIPSPITFAFILLIGEI